jgi:hypothetical protein
VIGEMHGVNPNIRRLVRTIVDETWETLRPEERARTSKAIVVQRLINAVAAGERDPVRLRIEAIAGVVTSTL